MSEHAQGLALGRHAFGVGPGMQLSAAFFHDVVEPLADARLGRSSYAAGLLGQGSEVLGLDTALSADHDWGPRVVLFVDEEALEVAREIEPELPAEFAGVSLTFGAPAGGSGWVHPFEVSTVEEYFSVRIGFHAAEGASLVHWLATPAMSFLSVLAGAVFHDGCGALTSARVAADWYPDDIWRWLAACQWRRIGEEQPFVERALGLDDRLGAGLVASRVIRDAMRLAFLLERRHAPYSKWLGTAFAGLELAEELIGSLRSAQHPDGDPGALCAALEVLGQSTNQIFGTGVDPSRRPFYDRPIQVAPAGEFTAQLIASIASGPLAGLRTDAGNVDMLFGTNNGGTPGAEAAFRSLLGDL